MKKLLLALCFLPSLLFAQNTGYVIKGNIAGIEEGTAKIVQTNDPSNVLNAGMVAKGQFELKGSLPEPGLYLIQVGSEQPFYVFLENSNITITGSKGDMKNLRIDGSSHHKEFDIFQNIFNPLIASLNMAASGIQQASDDGSKRALLHNYDSIMGIVQNEINNFVKTRNKSYVSPFLLAITATMSEVHVVEERYNMLSNDIKASMIGKSLADFIDRNKVVSIGSMAMDFTQNDVSDKPVSLSSFKGKYVLIDFWASWCRPCRVENPNVVKAYNRFKSKNFTVLGVSLDQDKNAWVNAIQKDNLTWTNVSDLKFWQNEAAVLYKVGSIPQNFLIDPNGKIIAKDLHGEALEKKLCELLGCK